MVDNVVGGVSAEDPDISDCVYDGTGKAAKENIQFFRYNVSSISWLYNHLALTLQIPKNLLIQLQPDQFIVYPYIDILAAVDEHEDAQEDIK